MRWIDLGRSYFAGLHYGVDPNPEVRSEHLLCTFVRAKLFTSPLSVLDMTYSINGNKLHD